VGEKLILSLSQTLITKRPRKSVVSQGRSQGLGRTAAADLPEKGQIGGDVNGAGASERRAQPCIGTRHERPALNVRLSKITCIECFCFLSFALPAKRAKNYTPISNVMQSLFADRPQLPVAHDAKGD
jgi:hypothetical protein